MPAIAVINEVMIDTLLAWSSEDQNFPVFLIGASLRVSRAGVMVLALRRDRAERNATVVITIMTIASAVALKLNIGEKLGAQLELRVYATK